MDKVTLEAQSLAVVTKITRELVEDTNVEDELRRALARRFALKIDQGAPYGAGNDEPTGLLDTSGITKTNVAANGGPPTWDLLVDGVGRVRDANETRRRSSWPTAPRGAWPSSRTGPRPPVTAELPRRCPAADHVA